MLDQIGVRFEVRPGSFAEPDSAGRDPVELVEATSRQKAQEVAAGCSGAIVIGADTLIAIDGIAIGKPRDRGEALRILGLISGREHRVITGFTLIDSDSGRIYTRAVTTRVFMKNMTYREIEAYVDTGEGLDKAGAYAIQGRGAILVESIEGDYANVVGLPLYAVAIALEQFGIQVLKSGKVGLA